MDDTTAERVGAWIRKAREYRGLRQQDLAAKTGGSVSRLSDIERGVRGKSGWNLSTLRNIEAALDVPYGTIQRVVSGEDVDIAKLDDTPDLGEILSVIQALSEKVEQRDGELVKRLDALDERVRSLGG